MTLILVFPPAGLQYYLELSSLCCIGKIWNSLSLGHYLLFKNNIIWKNSCYLILGPICLIKLGIFSSRKKLRVGSGEDVLYLHVEEMFSGRILWLLFLLLFKNLCFLLGGGMFDFGTFYVSCLVVLNFNSSLGNSGWAHSVRVYVS